MDTSFSLRKTVSLSLGFSFTVMSMTGLVLFITPKGKIAYWSDWLFLGLSKEQWADLHITSMVVMLIAGVWHIYYNWGPLVGYLKNRARKITPLKGEFLAALVLNVLFVIGTLYGVPPFQTLLDFNEDIKSYWERTDGAPPYGHAEASTLKTYSRFIGLEPEDALSRLRAKGIAVESSAETLEKIAAANQTTPQALDTILRPQKQEHTTQQSDVPYLGRRTLDELAEMKKIDLQKSLVYLKKQGFDASGDVRMKQVADHFEVTPYEMYGRLQKVSGK